MSTPAIHSLRVGHLGAHIVALVDRRYLSLLAGNPDIDVVEPYHGGFRRFFRTAAGLRKYRFDVACILHGNEPQATPLAYLSGATYRFKRAKSNPFAFLLSHGDTTFGEDARQHVIERRIGIARLAGGAPVAPRMVLRVSAQAEREAADFVSGVFTGTAGPLVVFQPGASEPHRMWPADNFAELGRRLIHAQPIVRIVVTGSRAEAELSAGIAQAIGPQAAANPGILSLPGLAALARRADALVSGDTGIMHMAIAVQTPVVALFASADPRLTGPLQDGHLHTVVEPPGAERAPLVDGVRALRMADICLDDVWAALARRLAGS